MSKQPKRGRPALGDENLMSPITLRFPPDMMMEIDVIHGQDGAGRSKGQVVRDLVKEALVARKSQKGRK
jgi:hypothetical protein